MKKEGKKEMNERVKKSTKERMKKVWENKGKIKSAILFFKYQGILCKQEQCTRTTTAPD